jgi:hypothetical protein
MFYVHIRVLQPYPLLKQFFYNIFVFINAKLASLLLKVCTYLFTFADMAVLVVATVGAVGRPLGSRWRRWAAVGVYGPFADQPICRPRFLEKSAVLPTAIFFILPICRPIFLYKCVFESSCLS